MKLLTNNKTRCFIIAEVGLNHNGDYQLAKETVISAAKAGADAVKFQNFVTEDFLSDKSILHTYKDGDAEVIEPLFDICKRSEFKVEWLPDLIKLCGELGVVFLSTPTSESGVDDLISNGVKYIKNGSDYLSHIPLLKYMASTGATVIISTGMAYQDEIDDAVNAILSIQSNKSRLVILHCTSSYPTSPENVNLKKSPAAPAGPSRLNHEPAAGGWGPPTGGIGRSREPVAGSPTHPVMPNLVVLCKMGSGLPAGRGAGGCQVVVAGGHPPGPGWDWA